MHDWIVPFVGGTELAQLPVHRPNGCASGIPQAGTPVVPPPSAAGLDVKEAGY